MTIKELIQNLRTLSAEDLPNPDKIPPSKDFLQGMAQAYNLCADWLERDVTSFCPHCRKQPSPIPISIRLKPQDRFEPLITPNPAIESFNHRLNCDCDLCTLGRDEMNAYEPCDFMD